jgi:hypothetical protein
MLHQSSGESSGVSAAASGTADSPKPGYLAEEQPEEVLGETLRFFVDWEICPR